MLLAYIVYIGLIITMILLSIIDKQFKLDRYWNIFVWLPIVLFSLVIGMRYNVGSDYMSYYYNYISQSSDGMSWWLFEPGFVALNRCLFFLNLPVCSLFILVSFIQIIFFYKSFQNNSYLLPIAVFLLFVLGYVFVMMNILRQAIAIMIVFAGVQYLESVKNVWKFVLCLLFAFFFFFSVVICIPMLFLYLMRTRTVMDYRCFMFTLYVILVFMQEMLLKNAISFYDVLLNNLNISAFGDFGLTEDRLSKFGGDWQLVAGTGLGRIMNYLIVLIMIIFSGRLFDKYGMKFLNYFRLYYWGELLILVSGMDMNLRRVAMFYTISSIVVIAYFFYFVYFQWKSISPFYRLSGFVILIYYSILFVYKIYMGESLCSPFQFIYF